MLPRAKHWSVPLGIGLLVIVIAAMGERGREAFEYLGPLASSSPSPHRWITGHFTHIGWSHSALNLAGLLSVWFVYGRVFSQSLWLTFMIGCTFGISLGFHFFSPQITYYVGLSGLLHGMLSAASGSALLGSILRPQAANPAQNEVQMERREIKWEELLVFGGVWAKVAYEQLIGSVPLTAEIAGGPVVIDAHLYGACLGTIVAVLPRFWRKS